MASWRAAPGSVERVRGEASVPVAERGWEATLVHEDGAQRGTCLDISPDRIDLSMPKRRTRPGAVVGVVLSVPGVGPLYGRARVHPEARSGGRVALRWIGLSARLEHFISALLAAHEARLREALRLRRLTT